MDIMSRGVRYYFPLSHKQRENFTNTQSLQFINILSLRKYDMEIVE